MDEIFGEENFVCDFIWNHRKSSQNDIDVSLSHNYTLVYAFNRNNFKFNPLSIDDSKFSNLDNDPRGEWVADPMDAPGIRKNLAYQIVNPLTKKDYQPPEGRHWRFTKEKFEDAIKDNRIVFGKAGESKPQYKRFKFEAEQKGTNPFTIWNDVDTATNATKELMNIFNGEKVFDTPKPVNFLLKILNLSTNKNSIILDSFAGTGTTAHAVLDLNKEGGGNRKFILVEMEDYADKITAERVRRVIKGYGKEEGTGGTFSYFDLGEPIEIENILSGKSLPSYTDLARYVFYTATGEEFDEKNIIEDDNFIGESKDYDVYLFYKPNLDYLKSTALTLNLAEKLKSNSGKKKLVFAPTKYIDQDNLDRLNITFAQLPFEIYKLTK